MGICWPKYGCLLLLHESFNNFIRRKHLGFPKRELLNSSFMNHFAPLQGQFVIFCLDRNRTRNITPFNPHVRQFMGLYSVAIRWSRTTCRTKPDFGNQLGTTDTSSFLGDVMLVRLWICWISSLTHSLC